MTIKNRQLLETELSLVRDQRATKRLSWVAPETARGAEEALTWLLAGRPSPAPLSESRLDPTLADDVRRESDFAEQVWFGSVPGRGLSAKATSGNVSQYAHGVSKTLGWACGASEDDAFGRDDEDIREDASELVG